MVVIDLFGMSFHINIVRFIRLIYYYRWLLYCSCVAFCFFAFSPDSVIAFFGVEDFRNDNLLVLRVVAIFLVIFSVGALLKSLRHRYAWRRYEKRQANQPRRRSF